MAYKYLKYVAFSAVLMNENTIVVLEWKLLPLLILFTVGWTI